MEEPRETSATRRAGLGPAIALLVGYVVVQSVIMGVLFGVESARRGQTLEFTSFDGFRVIALATAVMAIVVWFVLHSWFSARELGLAGGGARAFLHVLPIVALAYGSVIAAAADENKPLIATSLGTIDVLVIVGAVFVIGVSEELVFRGAILNLLGGIVRPVGAVIAAAVLFGVPHLPIGEGGGATYVNAVSVMFAVGVPFALVWIRNGGLWGLIAAHAVFDLGSLLYLGGLDLPEVTMKEAIGSVAGSVVIAAIYAAWFARWWRAGGRPTWHPAYAPVTD